MLKVIVQKYVFSKSTWNQPNLKSRCSTCGRRRIDIRKRRRTQISTRLPYGATNSSKNQNQ